MGDKDITQKNILKFRDIAAGVVNGALYHGDEVVKEEELESKSSWGAEKKPDGDLSKDERMFSEREGDRLYRWDKNGNPTALFNIENQMSQEGFYMVYRAERYMLDGKTDFADNNNHRGIPAISIIVNWNEEPWRGPTDEFTEYENHIPDFDLVKDFVGNNRVYILNMRNMPVWQRRYFRNDLRFIVEALSSDDHSHFDQALSAAVKIRHPLEVGYLLSRLLNDEGIERFMKSLYNMKGDEEYVTMRTFLDAYGDKRQAQGEFNLISRMMKANEWTFDQAMDECLVPESERSVYREMYEKSEKQ